MGLPVSAVKSILAGDSAPWFQGAFHVEFPNYYRNPWGFTSEAEVDAECLRQIELVLKRERRNGGRHR